METFETARSTKLVMNSADYTDLIIEGKTKKISGSKNDPNQVLVISKDRITAGDGVKAHDLEGKAAISTQTNAVIFELLNKFGLKTAFQQLINENAFLAKKCEMIPIEWVTRRYATGSFLKRNPNVSEGYRFSPIKLETFYKDDVNHDPQWSRESLLSANLTIANVTIGETQVEIMEKTAVCVFEILEKIWNVAECSLIDMKIEFGIDNNGDILLADVIDSDSWRLWPKMQKSLMVDKQVYRDLNTVTQADLQKIKTNFLWVHSQLSELKMSIDNDFDNQLVVIVMGSVTDKPFCLEIQNYCQGFGLKTDLCAVSAHKQTEDTLKKVWHYESLGVKIVFIAVAGRSNGLGLVISGNSNYPVINCPPINKSPTLHLDIWSSLNVPSGLGCATVLYPESAALCAAQILSHSNVSLWCSLNVRRLNLLVKSKVASRELSKLG